MEAVNTQDISVNDLPWKIEYKPDQCTLCGSCVAACTFAAIHVDVQRRDVPQSIGTSPEPQAQHLARPVIVQTADLAHSCCGCGMCEKICPTRPSGLSATLTTGQRY